MPIISDLSILKRWNSFYGSNEVTKFQFFNKSGINDIIRVNHLKMKDDQLINKLKSKFKSINETTLNGAFVIKKSKISIGATNEFLLGQYAIQGLASQYVSTVLNPLPNELILDMSSAPGGKTAHMSSLMDNSGIIVGIDKSKKRLTALRSNLSRLGVKNVIALEGYAEDIIPTLNKFDKVLLDAPCSGSGSICRTPKKPWNRTENDINRLSKIQLDLLESGLHALKINGFLVYSTCSIEPEEGEIQIINILNKFSDKIQILKSPILNEFKKNITVNLHNDMNTEIKDLKDKWARILPTDNNEGFFICKIKKIAEI